MMGSPNILKKLVGKTISLWCGEYDEEGYELIPVIKVENVENGWLVGTTAGKESERFWFNIKQIVYFQEGDCFSVSKGHLEVVLSTEVSEASKREDF